MTTQLMCMMDYNQLGAGIRAQQGVFAVEDPLSQFEGRERFSGHCDGMHVKTQWSAKRL